MTATAYVLLVIGVLVVLALGLVILVDWLLDTPPDHEAPAPLEGHDESME